MLWILSVVGREVQPIVDLREWQFAIGSSTIVEFLTQMNQGFTKAEVIKTLATLAVSLTIVVGLLSRFLFLPRCVLCGVLINPKEASVIIATKNCVHCGGNIINNS